MALETGSSFLSKVAPGKLYGYGLGEAEKKQSWVCDTWKISFRWEKGGFQSSQDGSSTMEDKEEEEGLLLGAEMDDSGSVVGVHLTLV
ncbi:hypothetical protein LOK49_LG09G02068 [Camellia lanceoleosa]|uniref:Uncharacterized protein n=1 Tax=Camellia lanceoleosa TaxID=1840588 RepID=A0ACC0GLG9_9ERIC|nr:hypothetical protein LOK49_LG09G02068 [Camellia lanceoleosa]